MPQQIGKYLILGRIGAGGMGVVYKGYHPIMKRAVAIKTMTASSDADPRLNARFYREVQAVAQLAHRNIVSVYDVGDEDNRLYLVMEYLEGEDLRAKLTRHEPPSLEEKLHIMMQVCEGLAHAHNKGITHRDIKPSNIFVTTAGEVKILDFGLARQGASDLTATGEVLGTPSYMSPEMLQKEMVDHRADIYSAGVVFHEMFTYRKAFDASQIAALLVKILEHEPEPLHQIDSRIPCELSDIVHRAIAKAPESRYQSMEQLCACLAQFQNSIVALKQTLNNEAGYFVEQLAELVEGHAELLADARTLVKQFRAQLGTPRPGRGDIHADETPPSISPLAYFDLCDLRNRARGEYGRFLELLEKRQRAVAALEAAASLEKRGEFEEALAQVEQVLAEDPTFPSAVDLQSHVTAGIKERRLHEETVRIAEASYDNALRRFQAGDLVGCVGLLGSALQALPGHAEAQKLLELIRQTAKPDDLTVKVLPQAREACARNDFRSAMDLVTGVHFLQPGDAETVNLLGEIKQAAKVSASREAAVVLLAQGRELLSRKEYPQAAAAAREALRSTPGDPGAQSLLEEIERRVRVEERSKQRQERLEAKEHLRLQQLPGPTPTSAYTLPKRLFGRATIRTTLRWVSLGLILSAALGVMSWYASTLTSNTGERNAQALFHEGNYEEADRVIGSWLGKDPGNQTARRLQERARRGVDQLSAYDAALADNDYAKAEGALLQIQQINPNDPNLPKYRLRLEEQFGAFGDEFDDLQGWLAPPAWESVSKPNDKRLLVRAGLGLVRGRRYRDFDASFNLTFGQGDTAAWVLRAADERNFYLLQLNGPRANPPDSFLSFKVVQGKRTRLLPPVAVGKDLGRKDDQLHIIVKARGTKIQHFIESGLAPEPGDPIELAPLIDAAFAAGAFGFLADGATDFVVRAVSVEPVRGSR